MALVPPASTDPETRADLHDVLRDAMDAIAHRGPDGSGAVEDAEGRLLGHRRLAIIDPCGGHQPLRSDDGDVLVANGMIYNDLELRAELGDGDYGTGSDSESILHAVRHWGPDAPRHLDGMFAFVYANDDRIIAARDPLGKKPLYRVRIGTVEGFSSEVKAFDGVADEIEEFPAGHVFDSETGTTVPFYEVPEPQVVERGPAEVVTAIRAELEAAVVKRLRSHVPFGALLSGGLDSSLICALARQHLDGLHTFAVGLEGSGDLLAARVVAEHLGTDHHELVVTREDVERVLPDVLYHLESADVDLVRSAVVTWLIMEFASRQVTVVLTGEGADELFAGYAYHADYDDPDLLQTELRRSLTTMHNINLQRVDRMSMAHGVEARVPFLDPQVIAEAMRVDPDVKQHDPATGEAVEKWVLRKVAEGLLPAEIVWRTKAQFDQGTGMSDLLPLIAAEEGVDEGEWYAELLAKRFVNPDHVAEVAGTWTDDRT